MLSVAAFLLAAPVVDEPASEPKALAPLASLFSNDDYPIAALRGNQQGEVGFSLEVGTDGKVRNCKVSQSSGSVSLDSTTCMLLTARALFTPAKDIRGRPIAGTATGTIRWKLADENPTATELPLPEFTGATLWLLCVAGGAAKLTISTVPVADAVNRSFDNCTELEAIAYTEYRTSRDKLSDGVKFLELDKVGLRQKFEDQMEAARTIINSHKVGN